MEAFDAESGPREMIVMTLFVTVAAAAVIYLLPFVVAFTRRRPGWSGLLALNILIGWTVIGWIAALIWAASTPKLRARPRTRLAAIRRFGRARPKPVVFAPRAEPLVEPPPPDPADDSRSWADEPPERPDAYADWLMAKRSS